MPEHIMYPLMHFHHLSNTCLILAKIAPVFQKSSRLSGVAVGFLISSNEGCTTSQSIFFDAIMMRFEAVCLLVANVVLFDTDRNDT